VAAARRSSAFVEGLITDIGECGRVAMSSRSGQPQAFGQGQRGLRDRLHRHSWRHQQRQRRSSGLEHTQDHESTALLNPRH